MNNINKENLNKNNNDKNITLHKNPYPDSINA